MNTDILIERAGAVWTLAFNRPEKRNALTHAMYVALVEALEAADADPDVRAVILTGAGNCFTAGNDLQDFLKNPPLGVDSPVIRFLHAISRFSKPLLAAVPGVAVGIGTTMLLHCDLVYAAPNARFQLPFVRLGLVPEAGSSLLLPAIAGYQRAAELLMLGQPFDANKALAAGFVTEIVPEAELIERARGAAHALAELPPASVRLTKRLMKASLGRAVGEQIDAELREFKERLGSPEAKEAMTAFFEKRKPDFSKFS